MNLEQGIFIPGAVPHYRLEANEEPARSVLMRALAVIARERGRIGWLLFEDPKGATYVLNGLAIPDKRLQAPLPLPPSRESDAPPQRHGTGAR
jgi:hypothetical protein